MENLFLCKVICGASFNPSSNQGIFTLVSIATALSNFFPQNLGK